MAQNVTIAGNQYPSVPYVDLDKTGGGTARFYDEDGSLPISQNGTYNVSGYAGVSVSVSGGGGTEVDMYAGRAEPAASSGDLWVDTSDERGDWPPSTITAGDTPVMFNAAYANANYGSGVSSTGISLTVPKAGTYRFVSLVMNTYYSSSSSHPAAVRYYQNNSAVGTQSTIQPSSGLAYKQDISCNAGDTITVYANSANSTYTVSVFGLTACINGDNGF